jgi:hypothetical protein
MSGSDFTFLQEICPSVPDLEERIMYPFNASVEYEVISHLSGKTHEK